MMLGLYRTASWAASPAIDLFLKRRLARGKEDPERFNERQGIAVRERPVGALIWAHAASVGESLSLLPLIEALVTDERGFHVMVTTGTVTSARMMDDRLPEKAFHQFVPVDRLAGVRRFLDHWRPDLVLWSESEFWPNLVCEPAARGIPLVLVNGRVSPKAFRGWRRFPSLIRRLLKGFDLCLAQSDADKERLRDLGAERVECAGNLKFAAPPLPSDSEETLRLQGLIGDRPRWLAASTHPGEEDAIWNTHQALAKQHPNLLSLIVPRHPERGPDIAAALSQAGARVALRSRAEPVSGDTDVYVADTMGELGMFFRLCDITFMGKSLVPLGGQNLLEPARLGCAVLFGPHMENFAEISRRMIEDDAAVSVDGADGLTTAVGELLADAERVSQLADAAQRFAAGEAGVLNTVREALEPYLAGLSDERASRARA